MALPVRGPRPAPTDFVGRFRKAVELRTVGTVPEAQPSEFVVATRHADIVVRQSVGRKLPTLLIHGNSACKEVFHAQINSTIGQEYRLIAVDLPGHGGSSDAFDPNRSYTMPGYADAMAEVLEALGIEQVAVVGWSLGGHIGLEMMSIWPDLVGVMAIAAPPVDPTPATLQRAFQAHPDLALACQQDLTDEEAERFSRTASGGVDVPELRDAVRRADGRARRISFEALASGKVSDQRWIAENNGAVSLALVNGANDPFLRADYLSELRYANLWRNTCHFLPRASHAPFLEAPQVFNNLLSNFLTDMTEIAQKRSAEPPVTYSA